LNFFTQSLNLTFLPAITVVGFDGKTRFVALPGPDLPCAGSTEPSMGMKVTVYRGIPNLNLSRPLFPEGDVSI
jgi:hypothetical protein